MIRTLIVDDEPLARRHVRDLLAGHGDFELVGEAGHGGEAIARIEELRPDLVFLDIQMPETGGFDVIDAIGVEKMPLTVFVTAHDAFAVRAFEVLALDYLLKPFDDLRLLAVLDRVRRQIADGRGQADRLQSLLGPDRPLLLVARSHGGVQLIRLEDVDWIGAAGDYAEVHVGERAHLLNDSLAALEARLPADSFARIHRSAIVRLDRLAEIRSGSHGDGVVRLRCGSELRFSRRYRKAIDLFLQT